MIIDLCCGLGLSEWPTEEEVVGVDIDPKVKPTIVADVRHLPLRAGIRPQLVHASPPCQYLSHVRWQFHGRNLNGISESLRIIAACFDAFEWLDPQMWTLEQPDHGYLRRLIPPSAKAEYENGMFNHKKAAFYSNKRSLRRALIPKHVKAKILEAR